MRTVSLFAFALVLCSAPLLAAESPIELSSRLQPGRVIKTEVSTETLTTLRVLEDRGIVAKSNGRMSASPVTLNMRQTHVYEYDTGHPSADGSFSAQMRILDEVTILRGADDREQVLPERAPAKGLTVSATIEADGTLRPNTVRLTGLDPAAASQAGPTVASVLAQAASIPTVALRDGKSVPQEIKMQIPIPGIAAIDLKMTLTNQLLAVENEVAKIQLIYVFDFGTAPLGTWLTADGTGGGIMVYDVKNRQVMSMESTTLMKLTIDFPDGVVEMRLHSKEVRRSQMSSIGAR